MMLVTHQLVILNNPISKCIQNISDLYQIFAKLISEKLRSLNVSIYLPCSVISVTFNYFVKKKENVTLE